MKLFPLSREKIYSNVSQSLRCIVGMLILSPNARWLQNGVTVAGGNGAGDGTNQFSGALGLHVDDDNHSILIVDRENHRIVEWNMKENNGKVIAGGRGRGNRLNQLNWPTDVLIDNETDSLLIADPGNRRVLRWPRHHRMTEGEVIVDNIPCFGLAIDHQRYLYVSDVENHEVRRYRIGDNNSIVVAGGNGAGNYLDQLDVPTYLFVDEEQAVYVSDRGNHRVMKWNKSAIEGIVVAGGQGEGSALTQLAYPRGLFVDASGTLYVADQCNHRVMRWPKGAKQGTVIVGGNGRGKGADQLSFPEGLSFDRQGNLYVIDSWNDRAQHFFIK